MLKKKSAESVEAEGIRCEAKSYAVCTSWTDGECVGWDPNERECEVIVTNLQETDRQLSLAVEIQEYLDGQFNTLVTAQEWPAENYAAGSFLAHTLYYTVPTSGMDLKYYALVIVSEAGVPILEHLFNLGEANAVEV